MKLEFITKNEEKWFKYNGMEKRNNKLSVYSVPLKNTTSKIVVIETNFDNLNSARILSDLFLEVSDDKSINVITNDASKYFNTKLYPLVNDFERLLRKFVYIGLEYADDGTTLTKRLEEMDFTQIYQYLFVDEEFTSTVKIDINKNYQKYSKNDLLNTINKHEENSRWNILFNELEFDLLEKNYNVIKEYRNSIMHAHNIDYKTFIKAQTILENTNNELQSQTERILLDDYDTVIDVDNIQNTLENIIKSKENLNKILRESGMMESILKAQEVAKSFENLNEIANKLKKDFL